MHVVGITGGIGSGKSSLAAAFAAHGVPVVDADVIARRCLEPGTPGLAAVRERFGTRVLAPDGSLDRPALAAVVFADTASRRDLEAITHPCIRDGIEAELVALRARHDAPAVAVLEHPLLVETGAYEAVDTVVTVEAPFAERLRRLTELRGMSDVDARARIAAQADDATRRAVAHVVVTNDGDPGQLRSVAVDILERIATGAAWDTEAGR